jgi:exonuclease VII large subunit
MMAQEMQVDTRNGAPDVSQSPAFAHVAVMHPADASPGPWGGGPADALATALADECLVRFIHFPIDYESDTAGQQIAATFAHVRDQADGDRFDAVLMIGGPQFDLGPDLMHQVLAPCIAQATAPVLTALGADDASTLLGDVAYRVFPDPHSLVKFVSTSIRGDRRAAEAVIAEIGSLAQFLVTEHAVEAKILMAAVLRPAVAKHLSRHEMQCEDATHKLDRITETLRHRVQREIVLTAQTQTSIGAALTRHAERRNRKTAAALLWLRLSVLLVFLSVAALSWYFTTPSVSMFCSGCALVLLSAVYVAMGNRIADQST